MAKTKRGFPSRPHWLLAAVAAAVSVIVAPQVALADGSFGQAGDSSMNIGCAPGTDSVQQMASGASYRIPGPGLITAWTTDTGLPAPYTAPTSAVVQLEVWRDDLTGTGTYSLVALSDPQPVTEGTGAPIFSIPAPGLSVGGGDLLGLRVVSADGGWWSHCAELTFDPGDAWAIASNSTLPTLPVTFTCCQGGQKLKVAANFVAGPAINEPKTSDDCKQNHWGDYTDSTGAKFKNQGDCVSYVVNGGSAAAS